MVLLVNSLQLIVRSCSSLVGNYEFLVFKSLASNTNVPKGTNEAKMHQKTFFNDQLCSIYTCAKVIKNSTNSTPCAQPTYLTNSGKPTMYFKGMATNNRSMNDSPSNNATSLKRPREVFSIIFILNKKKGKSL